VSPVSPSAVIGRAWEIYKAQFATLLAAAALASLVVVVAVLLLGPLAGLVSLVVNLFFVGGVVRLVQDLEDGRRDEELSALFSGVAPVFWPLLAVAILAGLGIGVGLLLLIVPGLILMTIWAVVVPVCVVERPGVLASFSRSRALVRDNAGPVFATLITTWLIAAGLSLAGGLIAAPLGDAGQAVVNGVVSALTLPLAGLVMSILYFRLRPR
jgi:hypothetical protein